MSPALTAQSHEEDDFAGSRTLLQPDFEFKAGTSQSGPHSNTKAGGQRSRDSERASLQTLKRSVEELTRQLAELQEEKCVMNQRTSRHIQQIQIEKAHKERLARSAARLASDEVSGSTESSQGHAPLLAAAIADHLNIFRERQNEPLIPVEQARHLNAEDVLSTRMLIMKEIADLLVKLDRSVGPAKEEVAKQIEFFTLHTQLSMAAVCKYADARFYGALVVGWSQNEHLFTPEIALRCLRAMNLTPVQKEDFLEVRRRFLERQGELKENRRKLLKGFLRFLPNPEGLRVRDVMTADRSEFLVKIAADISASLRACADHQIGLIYATQTVFTAVQDARLWVEAFPASPSYYVLSSCLQATEDSNLEAWLAKNSSSTPLQQSLPPPSTLFQQIEALSGYSESVETGLEAAALEDMLRKHCHNVQVGDSCLEHF